MILTPGRMSRRARGRDSRPSRGRRRRFGASVHVFDIFRLLNGLASRRELLFFRSEGSSCFWSLTPTAHFSIMLTASKVAFCVRVSLEKVTSHDAILQPLSGWLKPHWVSSTRKDRKISSLGEKSSKGRNISPRIGTNRSQGELWDTRFHSLSQFSQFLEQKVGVYFLPSRWKQHDTGLHGGDFLPPFSRIKWPLKKWLRWKNVFGKNFCRFFSEVDDLTTF
jgi:hypothetical protein